MISSNLLHLAQTDVYRSAGRWVNHGGEINRHLLGIIKSYKTNWKRRGVIMLNVDACEVWNWASSSVSTEKSLLNSDKSAEICWVPLICFFTSRLLNWNLFYTEGSHDVSKKCDFSNHKIVTDVGANSDTLKSLKNNSKFQPFSYRSSTLTVQIINHFMFFPFHQSQVTIEG